MDGVKVAELIDKMVKYVPIYKIEEILGMPKNTLQKALSEKEGRGLPKKWVKPLTDFVENKKYLNTKSQVSDVKQPIIPTNNPNEPREGSMAWYLKYGDK